MPAFQLPPLSLYIHTPWCIQKCPYCDFNSRALKGGLNEEAYTNALLADLESELFQVYDRPLHSIFIGGGTPSLFSGGAIENLLQGVRQRITCPPDIEITLEANPGTLEAGRFEHYRAAGVNRLSIGVQSFDNGSLQRLGRIHGSDEAIAAFHSARAAGFERINLDLMFGLPSQSIAMAQFDLEQAIELKPEHISYYQLTLEPGTPFYHSPPNLPLEDNLWEIQQQGQALLSEQSYNQYEISAYAQPGEQCCHNLNYWRFGDYLGIGAGAHGKSSHPDGSITRRWKLTEPTPYLAAAGTNHALSGQKTLNRDEIPLEFMMNALRLHQGFTQALFEERTNLPFTTIAAPIEKAIQAGLLKNYDATFIPTPLGLRFLNNLLEQFLYEQPKGLL